MVSRLRNKQSYLSSFATLTPIPALVCKMWQKTITESRPLQEKLFHRVYISNSMHTSASIQWNPVLQDYANTSEKPDVCCYQFKSSDLEALRRSSAPLASLHLTNPSSAKVGISAFAHFKKQFVVRKNPYGVRMEDIWDIQSIVAEPNQEYGTCADINVCVRALSMGHLETKPEGKLAGSGLHEEKSSESDDDDTDEDSPNYSDDDQDDYDSDDYNDGFEMGRRRLMDTTRRAVEDAISESQW